MLVEIHGWLRSSVHAFPRNPQPSTMAAIVENAENRQLGADLAYPQSSDTDSLLSSESVLDPSNLTAKGVDYGPVQKVNGLSHLNEDPLLQKTGANKTYGTGTVKADTQPSLVNCDVANTKTEFSETSRTVELVSTEMDYRSTISQLVQNKSPCLVAGKDEKKVELKVPLDSKSNCSLSLKKSENKLSLCDEDESKKFSVSSRHSGIEQKVGINFEIPKYKTNEQFSSSTEDTNKEKPLISENGTTIKTSTLEDKCSESDDNRLCKTAEKPMINGNRDSVYFKETKTISSATDHNVTRKKDSNVGMVVQELSEKTNVKSGTDHNATFKKGLTDVATGADKKLLEETKSTFKKNLSDIDKVADEKLMEKNNSKSATTLKKELTEMATIADQTKAVISKSVTDHTDALKKDFTGIATVVDKKRLGESNLKSAKDCNATLKNDLTDVVRVADEKLLEKNNLKSATNHNDVFKKDLSDVATDKKLLKETNSKSSTNQNEIFKKDLNFITTLADGNHLDKNHSKSATDHKDILKKESNILIVDKKPSEEKTSKPVADHDVTLKKDLTVANETKTIASKSATDQIDTLRKDLTHISTIVDKKILEETNSKSAIDCKTTLKKDLTAVATIADEKPLEKNNSKSATNHTVNLKKNLTRVVPLADERIFKEKKNDSKSSANYNDTVEKDLTDVATVADKTLLEKKNFKSVTDENATLKMDSNIASVVDEKPLEETNPKSASVHNDNLKKDSICVATVAGMKPLEKNNSKSATDKNVTFKKELTDIPTVAGEKLSEETDSKNCPESSSDSKTFSECLSKTKIEKSSGVSNIPELLAYCSPCRVVVQDFFKELNIDLLELSRNFPVHHRKRLKTTQPVQGSSLGEEHVKNNSFDVLGRTKQAKCYTESSKRRKKHPTTLESKGDSSDPLDDEDEEDNLPLLSVRNNLTQGGSIAVGSGKSNPNDNKTTATEGEKFKIVDTKGANSGTTATEERSVTDSTFSDVPIVTPPTNAESADQKMPFTDVPPTVNIDDSNDLGLKIVSISSQGSVFFPAFTSDDNSENIVFSHSDTSSKLNGQLDTTTCENSTTKLSRPKCKFHGHDSSPAQNLYKCKKCGLEAKSLSDIQAHMAGSHSEFCMYRCPFCMPPLRVKRVSIYDNRPIEFEVLRESSHKLLASASATNTASSAMTVKRKLPRHIRIQREKRRKLNYYYHNQREIKKYKNRKVSCQYCHKMINQSNISRHQNSKKCSNPMKKMLQHSLMLREKIPKKYQKVKCESCQKHISRTNMSKHSRICPRETED